MIRTARAGVALRCAWCHGDAEDGDARCACGTLVHQACLPHLRRCPTLGCSAFPQGPRSRQVTSSLIGVAVDFVLTSLVAVVVGAALLTMAGVSVRSILGGI